MNSGLFTVGLVVLILGIFAYFYPFVPGARPFDAYAFPAIVLGLLLMIVGSIVPSVVTRTRHTEVHHPDVVATTTTAPRRRTREVVVEE